MLGGVSRALLSAIVLSSLAIAPVRADAFGVRGGFSAKGGFQGFNPGGFQGFNPGGFQGFNPPELGRPFVPRFPKHGGFFGPWRGGYGYSGGGYGGPIYYVPAPGDSYGYDGPGYAYDYSGPAPYVVSAPPPVYAPPPVPFSTSVGPSAPPPPSTIDYPGGRYELRGDGLSRPYIWVWIPDPPAAPPASAGLPPGPGPDDRPIARGSRLYRWVDDQGVVHLTDNAEAVPEQYRTQAKPNTPL